MYILYIYIIYYNVCKCLNTYKIITKLKFNLIISVINDNYSEIQNVFSILLC